MCHTGARRLASKSPEFCITVVRSVLNLMALFAVVTAISAAASRLRHCAAMFHRTRWLIGSRRALAMPRRAPPAVASRRQTRTCSGHSGRVRATERAAGHRAT